MLSRDRLKRPICEVHLVQYDCFTLVEITRGTILAQVEAQEYLGSSTCSDYLRKAERRLAEETERTSNYLDPSSEPKVTRVVENELVKKQVLAHNYCLFPSPRDSVLCSSCHNKVRARL